MLNVLRHWHWTLLHRVFGLPDHNHTQPHAPLSVILGSHPAVPAHRRHLVQRNHQSLQAQIERERERQPRILKSWQHRIGALLDRQGTSRQDQDSQRLES
ncbi:MAG: hypothetical protein OJF49_003090 [Ktedonobacterales bacterium]|jgi:hypothetical protein|nr:MAG: hypothetical protein OJF49_003090 [Ktedonobacterales bacterium]